MIITGLIWLEDVVQNFFVNMPLLRKKSPKYFGIAHTYASLKRHRSGENVYAALGQTDAGRYLVNYFVYKRDRRALILSVRDMTDSERRQYGKK